jgi:transcriptional regulator with XRE-family HTH domain
MNITGQNIKKLRQKNGWSQSEVSKRLKISVPAFSKIETGITDINITRLSQLANLFEVNLMDIISKAGENPQSSNFEEIKSIKEKLAQREEEIIQLQKKVIALYEEVRAL